jgi:hypothetical protein
MACDAGSLRDMGFDVGEKASQYRKYQVIVDIRPSFGSAGGKSLVLSANHTFGNPRFPDDSS